MAHVLSVREVDEEDWALWRRLRRAALAEASTAFGSTLADWSGERDTEARWRSRLRTVQLNRLITRDETPVGMVSAHPGDDDGDVELIGLWVAPEERGRGVGDLAVRHVVDWAEQTHPGRPVGLSVKAANEHAVRLYRRHGFVDVGRSPRDPGERLMRRLSGRS